MTDYNQAPNLASYDYIAVSSSAGKDSQAMLDYVAELAEAAGVSDRVVVIHADLGRVEWPGTKELAERQAKHYGFHFEVVSRIGGVATKDSSVYKKGEIFGDMLDYTERRKAWPMNCARFCTSEFKRAPILKKLTALARKFKADNPDAGRACRILECIGLRAEESPARAKKSAFINRKSNKNQVVDTWLPIFSWLEGDVWARIKASGVESHKAYEYGMPRLSCVFCIFAPRAALILAGKHNPELLKTCVDLEKKINHTFKKNLSLAEIKEAVDNDEAAESMNGIWNM